MTELHTRVAVIGAGAAGLAAARRLRERGIDFLLIEARDRIGGRAYTVTTYDGTFPVELGAEFVHGRPQATYDLLRECGETTIGTDADSFEIREGRIEAAADERFETIERVLARIDIDAPDSSIEAFLATIPPEELSDRDRQAVRSMVEGFDAAIARDASAIGIAREWRSGVNDTAARPASGYAPLMQHLARMVSDRTLLRTPVDRIAWSSDGVTLQAIRGGESLTIRARHAIITVPVGVLQTAGLFSPALPAKTQRAIDAIAMGPVLRVVLDFRAPFWESLEDGRFANAGFFATPETPMRTLWTRAPQRTPLLVAWAGGGAAQQVIDGGRDPIEAAIATAAHAFPSVDIRAELRTAYFHDWQADPYARGAYSYLRVGAGDARVRLAAPVESALFFAGEAACDQDAGTVGGALTSGYGSAELIPR